MSPARPAFEGWDSALPSGSRVPLAALELGGATQLSDVVCCPAGRPRATGLWGVLGGRFSL